MPLSEESTIIRPAAILPVAAAAEILAALQEADVSRGGVWNATPGVWQRYTCAWDGEAGRRGSAELAGSIAVIYDRPRRNEITVFKATVTEAGRQLGLTPELLCDEALGEAHLSLRTCPRADLESPPGPDPFQPGDIPRQRTIGELLNTDIGKLLRTDVRGLFGSRR